MSLTGRLRFRRRAERLQRAPDPAAARALMEAAPKLGKRAARAEELAEEARVDFVEAQPLAGDARGPCEGAQCNRGRRTPRMAVWGLLEKRYCDRCAVTEAKRLDGQGRMATSIKTRRRVKC